MQFSEYLPRVSAPARASHPTRDHRRPRTCQRGLATDQELCGSYTLQVSMESNDLGCFWGNTLDDLKLPEAELEIAVFQICSGP